MKEGVRFTEIDLLRFLAAFSVMFFHYTFWGYKVGGDISSVWFPQLAGVFKYGYLGVELFFMISGFVILMSAIDRSAKNFLISRIVRLYPAFWVCCTITFIVMIATGINHDKATFIRYLANLSMLNTFLGIGNIDAVYWTLQIEMEFYFLIIVLLIFKQIHNLKTYLGLWLIIVIALSSYGSPANGFFEFLQYSPYFISGSVFYLIFREGNSFYKMVLIFGCFMMSVLEVLHSKLINYTNLDITFSIMTLPVLVALFYAVFFLISFNKTRRIRSGFYSYLGTLTYPLYLIHLNVGFILFKVLNNVAGAGILLFVITGIMLAIAYLVHSQIEIRYSPLFKRWLERVLSFAPAVK